jgi:hypothetical protein
MYSDDFHSDSNSEDLCVDATDSQDQPRGRGGGECEGSARAVGVPALGPFHPLLILTNLNAVARREREKAPVCVCVCVCVCGTPCQKSSV